LLLRTNRATDITPARSADNSANRARQTTFCGVFRREIHPSGVARSVRDRQAHAFAFLMPANSHGTAALGIFRQDNNTRTPTLQIR